MYVDRSLSMKPYLSSPQESDLYRLTTRLGDLVATSTDFYGFGFETMKAEEQSVEAISPVKLKSQGTYSFANNDYGTLFQSFSDTTETHLVISDGVQSDPKTGPSLRKVLSAIDQWVRSGGTFATLLYRTPYRGQYYSDQPGPDPQYSCEDRPLTVFVLGQSPSAVDNLLQRFGSELEPDHVVRLGDDPLLISPAPRGLAKENRRGAQILQEMKKFQLSKYDQVFKASVAAGAATANGFLPFQLEVSLDRSTFPWRVLDKEETETFLRGLETKVRVSALDQEKMESINESQTRRAAVGPISPQANGDSTLLRPADVQTRKAQIETVNVGSDSVTARFTVPMRKPTAKLKTPYYSILIRFGVEPQAARMLVPDGYSTTNDLNPDHCDRIYKLRRLVGSIMYRSYVPGQALVLAEWL